MRAALESLLRARKLDVTLTSAAPLGGRSPADRLAPTGCAALDAALGGGLRRGHLSEIVGDVVERPHDADGGTDRGGDDAWRRRGDCRYRATRSIRASAAAIGIDLTRVLWVRDRGRRDARAKAFSLILQAGGFGLVVLDLADVPLPQLRRFPWTTWMRIARTIEGGETVALLVGIERLARSPGGVTIALTDRRPDGSVERRASACSAASRPRRGL